MLLSEAYAPKQRNSCSYILQHFATPAYVFLQPLCASPVQLMLLSEGYVLYYGHALSAAHWLAKCGHPLPFGVSVPDHLLDLACADIPGVAPENSIAAKQELQDAFKNRKIGGWE